MYTSIENWKMKLWEIGNNKIPEKRERKKIGILKKLDVLVTLTILSVSLFLPGEWNAPRIVVNIFVHLTNGTAKAKERERACDGWTKGIDRKREKKIYLQSFWVLNGHCVNPIHWIFSGTDHYRSQATTATTTHPQIARMNV